MKTKTCSKCKQKQPISEFCKNKESKDGLNYVCRTCIRLYNKEYLKSPRVKKLRRANQLKYCFNITLDDYNKFFKEQKGRCLLCNISQKKLPHILHVDHDHKTGRVRGLLCKTCNNKVAWLENHQDTIFNYLKLQV